MNCEDAQIALAKEPLGLLDQEARRLLEHHLAECEACTKMYALSVALEDLKHTPVPSIPHIDTILTRQWLRERILMARAVTLVASVVALLWLFGTTTLVLTVSGAVALAAVSALWIIGRRRLARFHRLARDPSPGSFFNALKGY